MSWIDNVCRKTFHNCLKEDKCQFGTECCYERDTPSGKKGKKGTCVAKGSCDYVTGHPTNTAEEECPHQKEGYRTAVQKYKDCRFPKIVTIIGILILILLIFLSISYSYRNH